MLIRNILSVCLSTAPKDVPKIKSFLREAKVLVDLGGDWDRRNRLKVTV